MKKTLLRKTWPKIRVVEIKGDKFYQVDARRRGTDGRRETFALRAEAEKRAAEIETDFNGNGADGLAMSVELRGMAVTAERMLAPFDKTILQAAEFYRDWLAQRKMAQESALVLVLAKVWHDEKASGKFKQLRAHTLTSIRQTADILTANFGYKRILDVTTKDIADYLDRQEVGLQRKYNLKSLFSQFFNWCVNTEHLTKNPCDKIEIEVNGKAVAIFTPAQAEELLNVCQERFPTYTLYHAISLFGGLRPEECQFLEWEQIHLEERTIHVLAETSKIKESRNVHIEDSLLSWLDALKPGNAKGYVTPQVNFKKYTLQIHVAAGYRESGENLDASEWPQDVMRHSYGSYWLAKHGNRAQLAENMGNSIQIIKKHYKRVVSKSDTTAFWEILPRGAMDETQRKRHAAQEAWRVMQE